MNTRRLSFLALVLSALVVNSQPALGCDPDHIESVTITPSPVNVMVGGTATVTVTVRCIVTGDDLQGNTYQFDTRIVDDDSPLSDTTLDTHTYSAPGPKTDLQRARAVYTYTVTAGCPNGTIEVGGTDTGEGAVPCSDPAELWLEIDEGDDEDSDNIGNGHTTTRWPGDDVTEGSEVDACCVAKETASLQTPPRMDLALGESAIQLAALCPEGTATTVSDDGKRLTVACGGNAGIGSGRHIVLRPEVRFGFEHLCDGCIDPLQNTLDVAFGVDAILTFGVRAAEGDTYTIQISGPPPFVPVQGTLGPDGSFVATGVGTVAGFPNVTVQFEGTYKAGDLIGEYSMGAAGELPGGNPLVVQMDSRGEAWDAFFGPVAEHLRGAAAGLATLNAPAVLGGVDFSPYFVRMAGHLFQAAGGIEFDDVVTILGVDPLNNPQAAAFAFRAAASEPRRQEGDGEVATEALHMLADDLSLLADEVAQSDIVSRVQVETDLRTAAGLFRDSAGLREDMNRQRITAPDETLEETIDDLLAALNGAGAALGAVSGSLLGGPFGVGSSADYEFPVLAADSIASGIGQNLAQGSESATTVPLPETLSNTSIRVTDSEGNRTLAGLFAGTPGQFNFHLPPGLASGEAILTVFSGETTVATGSIFIAEVAPGLYSANFSGSGPAAAVFLHIAADSTRTSGITFDPNTLANVPIDLGAEGDEVYISFYGTGLRNASEVTATIDGADANVFSFGEQSETPGLDQVNVGPISREHIGKGDVTIILNVDGETTNPLTVNIG